ncbi:MAG: sulfotransferase [Cyanobacteria bacterium P01_F01_bin.150]
MNRPNFIIIGAAKGGTTALHNYLGQHPDIFVTRKKEPKFFTFYGDGVQNASISDPRFDEEGRRRYEYTKAGSICDLDSYHALFDEANGAKAIGESSPMYLYCPNSAQRIQTYDPTLKLIAILRNPVDRAFSHYMQYSIQVQGDEYLPTFEKAIAAEPIDNPSIWYGLRHYVRLGFYHAQLKRYFDRFDSRQIQVHLYEDFKQNPQQLFGDIFRFLNVNDEFKVNTSTAYNVGSAPKNQFIHRSLGWINTMANTDNQAIKTLKSSIPQPLYRGISATIQRVKKQNITEKPTSCGVETRQQLLDIYGDDIRALQDLIGRDLSHWLNPE